MIDYDLRCPFKIDWCAKEGCIAWGWVSEEFMKERKGCILIEGRRKG